MPYKSKKNGSEYWTINALVDRFYTSRFNRDNLHDPSPGEDIKNSRSHRLYNKSDIHDIAHLFSEFIEWVLPEENISKLYLSDNLTLVRKTRYPKIKRANSVDASRLNGKVQIGELYVTRGKYYWVVETGSDFTQIMYDLKNKDPEVAAKYAELEKEVEERNRIEKNGK